MKRLLILLAFLLTASPAHAVLVCQQWLKGTQFFTAAGAPLASGTINIYDATTTNLRTTYSNAGGTVSNTLNGSNALVLDSGGKLDESVYIPTGSWKFVIKDSGGSTLETEDNILGCLDTSVFLTGSVTAETPVITKSSDYTILTTDQGKVVNTNPTGGSITLTLPSAITAGDGFRISVRHIGTANTVTVATVSAQTIDGSTSRLMSHQYETLTLVSDGANWHVSEYGQASLAHGKFFGRTTAATGPPQQVTVPFGQARLAKSGSNLLLSPFDGNLLTINSAAEAIPDAGVTLTTGGLSNLTLYYIYAYMNSGTMTLEGSVTIPTTQAGTGIKIKNGDATRSLVGMAYLSGSVFLDSSSHRLVRSYYNDPGVEVSGSLSANATISNTNFVEVSQEIRIHYLAWSDELVMLSASGSVANSAGNANYTAFAITQNSIAENVMSETYISDNNYRYPFALSLFKSITEGYNWTTLIGAQAAGSAVYTGSSTTGRTSTLRARLKR